MRLLMVCAGDAAGFSSFERVLTFVRVYDHNVGDCCTWAHNLLNISRAEESKVINSIWNKIYLKLRNRHLSYREPQIKK